jgi:arginase
MHGMPLAASIGENNEECEAHKLDEKSKKQWDQLKGSPKVSPRILPEDIVFIGLRDFEKEEKHLIDKYDMKVITAGELRRKGAESVVRSSLRHLSECTDIYVSFDVDCLDSSLSKGTGTPVSNGIKEREAEDLMSKFMQNRKICCFEITEVNPTLDRENLMAEIAFNILQRSVNVLMMN